MKRRPTTTTDAPVSLEAAEQLASDLRDVRDDPDPYPRSVTSSQAFLEEVRQEKDLQRVTVRQRR